jgi:uncharacterized protein
MALAGAGLAAGALSYAALIEPRTLLIRKMDLAIPTMPESMNGTTIAFLSDLHVGGPGDPIGSIDRALDAMQQLQPDLILLGGDYYDTGKRVYPEPDWSRFPAIAPTFGIPGNHDYYTIQAQSEEIMQLLEGSGIGILRNRNLDVQLERGMIRLIGLDDPYTGRADFGQAIKGMQGDLHPAIMLAHAGLVADYLPNASADLILSGHTHAAQVAVSPFRRTGPMDVFWWLDIIKGQPVSPYRQGLFRVKGSLLYVGNGLGTTSFGVRFMAPPELAIIRLYRSAGRPDRSCDDPDRYLLDRETNWTTPLRYG